MCDKCAAEDVKMSAANVFQQCYNRRNEQSVCTDNGECKLEEPPSVNSKVDIQFGSDAMATLIGSKTTAIWMENNNGTITAKVLGEKPNADMTVQVTITEVKE